MIQRFVALAALGAFATLATPTASFGADGAAVSYPSGYRQWTHVKSMVIQPGHALYDSFGGIHHLYANRLAEKGYKSGKFPDGAVIAFDLLEAQSADNAVQEGPRKVLGVMVKNAQRFKATGGWGFEAFKGDSSTERLVGANAASACFQCHTAKQDNDFVFSSLRK